MIKFINNYLDYSNGQHYCEAWVYEDDNPIGVANYSLYQGKLYIDDIFVREQYRRQGYGSKLVKFIKQENPEYKYVSSWKTEDGSKFVHKDLSLESFKALSVRESLAFKRQGNPARGLRIGKWKDPIEVILVDEEYSEWGIPLRLEPEEVKRKIKSIGFYDVSLDEDDVHWIFQNWDQEAHPYLGFWIESPETDILQHVRGKDLEGNIISYQGELYEIPETKIFTSEKSFVAEGFQRGDVRKSLRVGKYSSYIFQNLKKIDPLFYEDVFDFFNQCPPLMKKLGLNNPEDIQHIIGFDEGGNEDEEINWDKISDEFEELKRNEYFVEPSGPNFRWSIGKIKKLEFPVILYTAGMNTGMIARKEWVNY